MRIKTLLSKGHLILISSKSTTPTPLILFHVHLVKVHNHNLNLDQKVEMISIRTTVHVDDF